MRRAFRLDAALLYPRTHRYQPGSVRCSSEATNMMRVCSTRRCSRGRSLGGRRARRAGPHPLCPACVGVDKVLQATLISRVAAKQDKTRQSFIVLYGSHSAGFLITARIRRRHAASHVHRRIDSQGACLRSGVPAASGVPLADPVGHQASSGHIPGRGFRAGGPRAADCRSVCGRARHDDKLLSRAAPRADPTRAESAFRTAQVATA